MRFEEILAIAVGVSGLICVVDFIYLKQRRKAADLKESKLVEYAKAFFPVLLIVFILRSFLGEGFRIPSGSMKPSLLEGDWVFVNKYHYGLRMPITGKILVPVGKPKRGDVIVFRHGRLDLIKRVIGLPGDHIQVENGRVKINGKPAEYEFKGQAIDIDIDVKNRIPVLHQQESLFGFEHEIYLRNDGFQPLYPKEFQDTRVPEGHYFVMGDNRGNSSDSRAWGFVPDQTIIGHALYIWLSWDPLLRDMRWERIPKKIQ